MFICATSTIQARGLNTGISLVTVEMELLDLTIAVASIFVYLG